MFSKNRLSTAVIIPTKERPEVLAQTLVSLQRQTALPDQLIVSATSQEDLDNISPGIPNLEVLIGPAGSCVQRNAARSRLREDVQIVFLLDDDVELAPDYLERVLDVFRKDPGIALVGGNVIAEGEMSRDEARRILAQRQTNAEHAFQPAKSLYGCNMAVRTDVLKAVDFDENLSLLGWLEDFDWSVRAGKHGKCGICKMAGLVHLKVNVGRTSGYKFGYAQVMNPYYLQRKGSIPEWRQVLLRHWLPLVGSNLLGAMVGDAQVDRRGRLRGNLQAFYQILRGNADPRRIEVL